MHRLLNLITKEFIQFLHQSLGSLAELETQVLVSGELNYVTRSQVEGLSRQIDEIQKMIYGLIFIAPAGQVASTSTKPSRRCVSPIIQQAW